MRRLALLALLLFGCGDIKHPVDHCADACASAGSKMGSFSDGCFPECRCIEVAK